MTNVAAIRKDEPQADKPKADEPDEKQPGIDVGIAFALDEKRSISIRTMFDQTVDCPTQEAILGRIFNVCSVMGLRERLIENRRERSNAERRLSELAADPERRTQLLSEIDALQLEAREFKEADERKFRENRQGNYAPAGAAKNRILAFGTDIERKRKELETLDADLKRQRDELTKAITNYGVAISNVESEIAIRREAYGE